MIKSGICIMPTPPPDEFEYVVVNKDNRIEVAQWLFKSKDVNIKDYADGTFSLIHKNVRYNVKDEDYLIHKIGFLPGAQVLDRNKFLRQYAVVTSVDSDPTYTDVEEAA